jgi:hypothetical protein
LSEVLLGSNLISGWLTQAEKRIHLLKCKVTYLSSTITFL